MKPDHTSASCARDHPGLPVPNVRGCIKIDLFTDTAAILNLLDLRSIRGRPEGTRSVFTRAFWAKRELQCIFLGKKADHYYIQTPHNDLFIIIITIFF